MDHITSDRTLKVGDLVLNRYSKHDANIWIVIEIERRFFTKEDCEFYYKDHNVGDEYNPIVSIQKAYDNKYSPVESKAIKSLDASWLKKLDGAFIKEMIDQYKIKITNLRKIKIP